MGAEGIDALLLENVGIRGSVNANLGAGAGGVDLLEVGIGGSVNVTNGVGLVSALMMEDVGVRGSVNFQTSAAVSEVDILGVTSGGNLNVQTGVANDHVFVFYSAFRGATNIRTDGGDDEIILGNSLFNGNVLLNTGPGTDYIGLAHVQADSGGPPLVFNRNLTVQMLSDDDMMEIGYTDGTGQTAEFYGAVNLDGGSNYNQLLVWDVNTFTQMPNVVNFDVTVYT
jgi:hypothetical protein